MPSGCRFAARPIRRRGGWSTCAWTGRWRVRAQPVRAARRGAGRDPDPARPVPSGQQRAGAAEHAAKRVQGSGGGLAVRISHQLSAGRQLPAGRVFLAGDAAHVHSPVGARGMNLGIEDGTVLARRMLEGTLENYSAERHPVGARVLRQTRALTRLVTARHPACPLGARPAVRARDRPERRSAAGARPPDPGSRLTSRRRRRGMAAAGERSYTPARKRRKSDHHGG